MSTMIQVTSIVHPDEFEFTKELQSLLNQGWELLHIGSGSGGNPYDGTPRLELVAILKIVVDETAKLPHDYGDGQDFEDFYPTEDDPNRLLSTNHLE